MGDVAPSAFFCLRPYFSIEAYFNDQLVGKKEGGLSGILTYGGGWPEYRRGLAKCAVAVVVQNTEQHVHFCVC